MKILPQNLFPITAVSSLQDLNNYSFPFYKVMWKNWKIMKIIIYSKQFIKVKVFENTSETKH